jgi:hypothetical protein
MNKIKWHGLLVIGIIAALMQSAFYNFLNSIKEGNAATVATGVTFTTNQTVQYYHLNNAINNATVSDVVSGDITDGTIANVDLGANAVTTGKVLDENLTGADILNRSLTINDYGTNSVDETALFTNLYFNAGFMSFSNVNVAAGSITNTGVLGVTSSAGAVSGSIPKLDGNAKIDKTLTYAPVATNAFLTTEMASLANLYTNLVVMTLAETNGYVVLNAQAHLKSKDSTTCSAQGMQVIRISGNTTPYTSNVVLELSAHSPTEGGQVLSGSWAGIINSTNTFVLRGISDTASAALVWGGTSGDYYLPPAGAKTGSTNSTGMTLINIK